MINVLMGLLVATMVGGLVGVVFFDDPETWATYTFLTVVTIDLGLWLLKGAQKAVDELFDLG